MRPVQRFTPEYLAHCRGLKPEDILRFLEDFRLLQGAAPPGPSRLISLRVPERLLGTFKLKAKAAGVPYQAQLKRLMEAWVREG